jgi:hypothetical protein
MISLQQILIVTISTGIKKTKQQFNLTLKMLNFEGFFFVDIISLKKNHLKVMKLIFFLLITIYSGVLCDDYDEIPSPKLLVYKVGRHCLSLYLKN